MEEKQKEQTCLACVCPCEKHKEHDHGGKDDKKENNCKGCGKSVASCSCG